MHCNYILLCKGTEGGQVFNLKRDSYQLTHFKLIPWHNVMATRLGCFLFDLSRTRVLQFLINPLFYIWHCNLPKVFEIPIFLASKNGLSQFFPTLSGQLQNLQAVPYLKPCGASLCLAWAWLQITKQERILY